MGKSYDREFEFSDLRAIALLFLVLLIAFVYFMSGVQAGREKEAKDHYYENTHKAVN
jgi:Na+-transporting methylmalonyl-CoA/oxaloacetate decarboxylase gamma subunit